MFICGQLPPLTIPPPAGEAEVWGISGSKKIPGGGSLTVALRINRLAGCH